jgi:hypothetical protein
MLCLLHGKPANRFRLIYPQPPNTPKGLLFDPPGPVLIMCGTCVQEMVAEGGPWAEDEIDTQILESWDRVKHVLGYREG